MVTEAGLAVWSAAGRGDGAARTGDAEGIAPSKVDARIATSAIQCIHCVRWFVGFMDGLMCNVLATMLFM